ncbi:MAG: type VI secretion system protein TssA [Phycisphaeraceae bacterium]|nr:type VI secretion system protein TssA [Phycisphaeraceae bacterium]
MAAVNVESLLKPLSPEAACGENLRWDRRFLELERLAEGKEETQFSPAEEPNWREVRDVCVEVFAKGKHLRTAILITLAAAKMDGHPGLRDGLKLIQGLLEQYWDEVFPQLDVEDNNDPTERVNALAPLATPMATFGDKLRFLDTVYEAPLCDSRQLGKYSLRDIAIAAGTLQVPPDDQRPAPTLSVIDAAFAETDQEILEQIAAAAEEGIEALKAIDAIFSAKCGAGIGPDLKPLQTMLKDAALQVRRRLTSGEAAAASEEAAEGSGSGGGGGGGRAGAALSGDVSSAADAVNAIDKVIRYYERYEPSSPVPLILLSAKQVVGKGFLEISRVLTPDAISVLERISQPTSDSGS